MPRLSEYELIVSPKAESQLKKISRNHQKVLIETFGEIIENPLLGKPLGRELTGRFSLRVGVYRLVYKIDQIDKKAIVLMIGHRGKVYN
ncbi:MAG: Addiction module toxin, RelE/StbE family [Candidatus Curtissbacteria bacterium GW2011_GWA1_41_11]|uniref:Addiction module toxin, RelE/StbE family n=1 Tax=Candidatus Curtissbacteria bacterium GW2011_GWA1_41_11 TaxID=1618409 RepID=A0A0G0UD20_9BACT|nr:MAG: Addiction module toxin, RelE/StbE family [Candidatus Curtissbacteria bacterium GW2011_GWA1_41_11]